MIIYFSCKICYVKCSFNRPREVVLCSSEPCRAGEMLKLCKLLEKRRRDWDFSSLRLPLVPRSSRLCCSLLMCYHILPWCKRKIRACLYAFHELKVNKMKDIIIITLFTNTCPAVLSYLETRKYNGAFN